MQFTIETEERQEMVDITGRVNDIIREAGVKEGLCNVFALHSTGAVIINENYDPNVINDFFKALNEAVPRRNDYQHDQVDGNAQSHILAALIGPSETIPIRDGELVLGRWQSLMFVELDGPRERTIQVTF